MEGNEQLAIIIPMLKEVGGNIEKGQLGAGTPCAEFDVAGVLNHMTVLGTAFALGFLGKVPEETSESTQAHDEGEQIDRFQRAMDQLLKAVQSPGALDRTIETPVGEMPGAALARLVALDGLIHGWDLATSTQQAWLPSDDLVIDIDAFARQALTPDMRGDAFAPEQHAPDNADPLSRLVAFSGRSV